ncbi:alginate lyase family protein [Kineosporia sp. A_224]|uniref:alginate lyase family protein n=1 Tax=Kineosporia sp. A_224 TaxID=1962180 RepID=UPI000B4B752A|nr:alginate lyase family protein [Kineosporia sp. A_224]
MTGPYGTALLTDTSVVLPDPPVATAAMLADAQRVLAGRWLLVGEEYDLGPDPHWERNPSSDKEWQIAQHKHYFGRNLLHGLLATGDPAYLDAWARLLRTWLTRMGTGFIVVSDAQVEALRLRSWVESLLLLREAHGRGLLDGGPAADAVDDDLLRAWVQRMGDEAHYVSTHLKPVRNHRTFQLHSVFLTGVCVPQAPGAKALVAEAVRLLEDNLLREILPDGVHVEMATHYHQLVAETALDVATLAARNGIAVDPVLLRRIHAMTQWSAWLTWPDGHIPLLGDSDDGDHAALLLGAGALFDDPELTWAGSRGTRGRRPAVPSRDFPDAGYTVLTDTTDASDPAAGGSGYEQRTHALVDSALLGEGAHAHYDALSVVLHCDGAPALVDPGRYTYSGDLDADGVDWRHTFKTTRAHNTVTVDGRDQTRYLSRNKHGPDAVVRSRAVHVGRDGDWVTAAVVSDEYTPVHTRVVVFVRRQYLLVVDRVAPLPGDTGEHTAEVAWHLPAGVTASFADLPSGSAARRTVVTRGTPAAMLLDVPAGADVRVDDGWVSTLYGVKHPAPVLRANAAGAGALLLVSAVAPRTTGVEVLGLAAAAGPVPAWDVLVRAAGQEVVDRIWLPPAPGAVTTADGTAVDLAGRFLLVRADASGRPLWATGEGVTGVVSGVGLDGLLDPAADGAVEDGGQPA